jgi:hypothetical protein
LAAERQQVRVGKRQALLTAGARLFNERGTHQQSTPGIAAAMVDLLIGGLL